MAAKKQSRKIFITKDYFDNYIYVKQRELIFYKKFYKKCIDKGFNLAGRICNDKIFEIQSILEQYGKNK